MAVKAASEAYDQAKVGPEDVDVIELHDCFSTNELITYEALVYKGEKWRKGERGGGGGGGGEKWRKGEREGGRKGEREGMRGREGGEKWRKGREGFLLYTIPCSHVWVDLTFFFFFFFF